MAQSEPLTRTARVVALLSAVLLLASFVFPAAVGLAKDTAAFPNWWGPADVATAFLIALLVFAAAALAGSQPRKQAEEITYRVYRVLIHGVIAAAVLVMLFGDRVHWAQCITGFLWRIWLALYCLPVWIAALRSAEPQRNPGGGE